MAGGRNCSALPARARGNVLAVLFALIFIAVGLGVGLFFAQGVFEWLDARDWVAVEAELDRVHLRSSRSSEGGTTYRVEASYRYRWQGREYVSDRVDLHPGSDNIGDYHQRMHARLQQALRDGRPVTAWVDHDDPARAVLNRDMRWGRFAFGMLFPLLFGGAGVFILAAGRRAARRRKERDRLQQRYPDQPWMWHEPWRNRQLRADAGARMWVAVGFAAFWNLVSAPLLFLIPDEVAAGNHAALFGLLFPAVGVGLVVWAVREVLRRRRYGDSVLQLDALPVPLGGRLAATLQVPSRLHDRELDVQLACVHRYRTGTGKNRRTQERLLWEDKRSATTRSGSGPGTTSARIEMRLPPDQPVASEEDPDNRIVWRLTVKSDEPGVDYHARFELPVFDTGEETGPSPEAADVSLQSRADGADWRDTGVEHDHAGGGQRFVFPRMRKPGAGLGVLVFALVFGGIGVFLIVGPGYPLFGGVFALVAVLILWGAITLMFQRSEIIVTGSGLRWRHGVFGGWQQAAAGEIKSVGIKRSGSLGRDLYYRLEIERWGHERTATLADWIPGYRPASALAAHLASLLGVAES